jgi:ribulose-5-phosphate 4-epimerase/fuculose-1-phosphate aldolase
MLNDIRQARIDLAAALRWAARLGYQTGVCNHFSVLAPGRDDLFLVNPEGYFWREVRASDLILCDLDGKILEGSGTVEQTAFFLHAPIHRRVKAARAVLHTHMPNATALCSLKGQKLEPSEQTALSFHGRIGYDEDYRGLALSNEEGDRVARILEGHEAAFLRNHGPVVVGASIAEAFDRLYYLEEACRIQLLALSTGRPLQHVGEPIASRTAREWNALPEFCEKHLAAIKRVLDREEPDYSA